jgi:inorganic pyrophosphatase
MHFLSVYKQLENKVVNVEELGDRKRAIKVIEDSLELYKEKILNEK